jgi:serine/threonine protein kinase
MLENIPKRFDEFEVINILGQGSFAVVLRAHDVRLQRDVALKVLYRLQSGPVAEKMFLKEARVIASLHHPNIITIYSTGIAHHHPYLAMRLVPGLSMSDYLKGRSMLIPAEALMILRQIASGLDAAHARGIIHRDIKPANILYEVEDRHVTITDFGLAKVLNDIDSLAGGSGSIWASPEYASPEQVSSSRRHNVVRATDIYSLAVLAYRLIAGRTPFQGDYQTVCQGHLKEEPPDPRDFNSRVPRDVTLVLLQGLEKKPINRPPTAGELVSRLAYAYKRSQDVSSQSTRGPAAQASEGTSRSESTPTARSSQHPEESDGTRRISIPPEGPSNLARLHTMLLSLVQHGHNLVFLLVLLGIGMIVVGITLSTRTP